MGVDLGGRQASWPSSSCTTRRSAPPSSRCVAKEWRRVCGETPPAVPRASQPIQPIAQSTHPERRAGAVQEHLGRRGLIGSPAVQQHGPPVLQVVGQCRLGRPAEEPDSLLATLAEDPDLAAPQVERSECGCRELADAQPRRICRLDQCPIPQREGGPHRCPGHVRTRRGRELGVDHGQQPPDLFDLQHSREPARQARRRDRAPRVTWAGSRRGSPAVKERMAARRCATVVRACCSPRTAKYARRSARTGARHRFRGSQPSR